MQMIRSKWWFTGILARPTYSDQPVHSDQPVKQCACKNTARLQQQCPKTG